MRLTLKIFAIKKLFQALWKAYWVNRKNKNNSPRTFSLTTLDSYSEPSWRKQEYSPASSGIAGFIVKTLVSCETANRTLSMFSTCSSFCLHFWSLSHFLVIFTHCKGSAGSVFELQVKIAVSPSVTFSDWGVASKIPSEKERNRYKINFRSSKKKHRNIAEIGQQKSCEIRKGCLE